MKYTFHSEQLKDESGRNLLEDESGWNLVCLVGIVGKEVYLSKDVENSCSEDTSHNSKSIC